MHNELVENEGPRLEDVGVERLRFALVNTEAGQTIAYVDMPKRLMLELIDPETATLRNLTSVKRGGLFTLVPVEQGGYFANALGGVQRAWKELNTPIPSVHQHASKIDRLLEQVGSLFGDVEFDLVDAEPELANLIRTVEGVERRKLKIPLIDAALQGMMASAGAA